MALRKPKKPADGEKLPDTPDMVAWRKEFEEMDLEAHKARLKLLGLDEDELSEFEEMEKKGIPIEDELMFEKKPSTKKITKKATKK